MRRSLAVAVLVVLSVAPFSLFAQQSTHSSTRQGVMTDSMRIRTVMYILRM
jgi:hypothetical protein